MLGVINLNKPTGFTSSDAVVVIRGILRRRLGKKIKVGHLGTLDPGGSGVLPIVCGKAARLFDYFAASDKLYRAEAVFGESTDTLDSYGKTIERNDKIVTVQDVEEVLPGFIGEIEQIPPKYSRVSVNGIRGVDAMHRGIDVLMPVRKVTIKSINIVRYGDNRVTLDILAGGGTYIRSLISDIAAALGTVGYMSYIIRLETKGLAIEDSVTLKEAENDIVSCIQPIDALLNGMPRAELDKKILNGLAVSNTGLSGDYIGTIDGDIYGICRDGKNGAETIVNLYDYSNTND